MSGLEISSKIINGLLVAKYTGEKFHLELCQKIESLSITQVSLKQSKRMV